jgi:hypothetical protein
MSQVDRRETHLLSYVDFYFNMKGPAAFYQ